MVQAFNPSNDVELSIFTTEPAWASENILTEIEQPKLDKDGVPIKVTVDGKVKEEKISSYWNTFKFLKRDLRLGNLNAKYDDFEWLENQIQNTQNILSLRNGELAELAPMSLIRVTGVVELSHSRGGFLRKIFRTFNINSSESSKDERKGFLGGFFR